MKALAKQAWKLDDNIKILSLKIKALKPLKILKNFAKIVAKNCWSRFSPHPKGGERFFSPWQPWALFTAQFDSQSSEMISSRKGVVAWKRKIWYRNENKEGRKENINSFEQKMTREKPLKNVLILHELNVE